MPLDKSLAQMPIAPRAHTAVVEILRAAIIRGDLRPGEVILEEEVARSLGISRTPVREALMLLAGERLVDVGEVRGKRARVRILDADELAEIYDLRVLLEAHGARRAARTITKDQLAELEACCDRMEAGSAERVSDMISENRLFHTIILTAARADRLRFIVGTLLQIPLAYTEDFWADPECLQRDIAGHRAIVAALRAGDSRAAGEAIADHLLGVADMSIPRISGARTMTPDETDTPRPKPRKRPGARSET